MPIDPGMERMPDGSDADRPSDSSDTSAADAAEPAQAARRSVPPRIARDGLKLLVVVAAYCGAAWLGLSLAHENSSITAVWAPTGIALAALVCWGQRMWVGVAIGAFLANALSGADIGLAAVAGITVGNTLEAVIGAYLLRRTGFRPSLERVRDVLSLVLLAGACSTLVSATVGVTSLAAAGALGSQDVLPALQLWWLGNMGGALIVAPVIFVLTRPLPSVSARAAVEAAAATAALVVLSLVIFSQPVPIAYLAVPLLVVVALRFGQPGAVLGSLVVASVAIAMTAHGSGPFARSAPDTSLLLSQTFVAVGAVTALVLAALTSERSRAWQALEAARDDLQFLVRRRTTELEAQGRQLSAAQEIDRAKDELLALISHDLRTPLTSILGYTQLLLDTPDLLDERGRNFVGVIDRNGSRLLNLVEDLIVLAQHQMGAFTVRRSEVDLAEIGSEIVVALLPAAAAKDVTLAPILSGPVPMAGDRDRLARMIDNLIANAINYTPAGGTVQVEVESSGGWARLRVRDDGPGIRPEDQREIFERFARARDAVDGGARGFGLGLTIARAIAEAHGGRIDVHSRPGSGATFWVELPTAPGDAPEVPGSPQRAAQGTLAGVGGDSTSP